MGYFAQFSWRKFKRTWRTAEGMVGPEEGPEPLKTLQNSWAKRRWFPAMFRTCPRAPVGKRPPITPL